MLNHITWSQLVDMWVEVMTRAEYLHILLQCTALTKLVVMIQGDSLDTWHSEEMMGPAPAVLGGLERLVSLRLMVHGQSARDILADVFAITSANLISLDVDGPLPQGPLQEPFCDFLVRSANYLECFELHDGGISPDPHESLEDPDTSILDIFRCIPSVNHVVIPNYPYFGDDLLAALTPSHWK
jgi:hypothetical protein